MSHPKVPSCSRAMPRGAAFALLGLVGITAAGCSDSARFDSNPYAANRSQPQTEVTGSIAAQPAPSRHVSVQPLPAPSRPATVAASGYAGGAQGLGAYRPGSRADITGSVPAPRPAAPAGHWTWNGGSAVMVARGQSLDAIARKHGVPASAILQVNGLASASAVKPGQRLVIPRYVTGSATQASASRSGGNVHVVAPGETLIAIARRNRVSLSALARANGISPYTKLNIGDRVTVPAGGSQRVASAQPAPSTLAQPRISPADSVASVPTHNARIAKAEPDKSDAVEPESVTKSAEPAGAMPSFRWPVRGRIIAGFGAKANGVQNDGINLAVPEGTPVKAADDGVVAYAGNELKGYGNLVLVRHANGFVSAYANASELLVKRGDSVKRGQVIAHAGQTGNVTSPQLHFEIRKGSTPVDPTKYLSGV